MAKSRSKMIKVEAPAAEQGYSLALYCRVSTDAQAEEGYSIDIQKNRLTNYVASLYPENSIIKYYIDDGYSGGSLDRPYIQKLIADAQDHKITHVIVMKLDRISRSQKDTLYLLEDVFLPNNIAFVSMQESFNTSTPFGRAVIGILSVFAQLERENIYERTRSGMQKRVEEGYWPGGGNVPFGYDYDKQQGILVPNKDAKTVKKIYDMYLEGYSCQNIANQLNLKYEKLVSQILTRKSNTGCIIYNDVEYQGKHEPIIDIDTYNLVMAEMSRRSSKKIVSTSEHLLTGLVVCGVCGAKMRYQKWGKNGDKLYCYSQAPSSKPYLVKDKNCDNYKVWAKDIEDVIVQEFFNFSSKSLSKDSIDDSSIEHSVLDILYENKKQLTAKLSRLYSLYGEDTNDILLDSINETKNSLKEIDLKIKDELEKNTITQQVEKTRHDIYNIRTAWDYMTIQEKRNALNSAIERITITHDNVHVEFKF